MIQGSNRRRYVKLFAASAAVSLGVVACGADENSDAEDTSVAIQDMSPDDLYEEHVAADEGPVMWYESSPEENAAEVVRAFNEQYPDVDLQHVRLVGGADLAARVVQESQAGHDTADVVMAGMQQVSALNERGMLAEVEWESLGVVEEVVLAPWAILGAANDGIILVNTDRVSEDEYPSEWTDLADEAWADRIGVRSLLYIEGQLGQALGADAAQDLVQAYIDNNVRVFESDFPLAQAVAAGQIDAARTIYQTAIPILDSAPVEALWPDPVPLEPLFVTVVEDTNAAYGARLFATWIASPEGALAYDEAVGRGNPYIEGTPTYERLQGREVSMWGFDDLETNLELTAELSNMLGG